MDKFIRLLVDQDLKEGTIKNYISQIDKLVKLFNNDEELNFIKHPEETILKVEDSYKNIGTISNKISLILSIIKFMFPDDKEYKKYFDKYKIYRDSLRDKIGEEYKKQEASPKQLEKSITPEQNDTIKSSLLKKVKHSIKSEEDIRGLRDYIIYLMYDTLNSRSDFIKSKFILYKKRNNYDKAYNYIVLNRKEKTILYVQNNYKTEGAYKQQILPIDSKLFKYFIKLYNAYKKLNIDSGYVFYQDNLSKPMTEENVSKLYSRIGKALIDKPISIAVMRVQKASNDYEAHKDLKTKARNMGHSERTHTSIYSKKNISKI